MTTTMMTMKKKKGRREKKKRNINSHELKKFLIKNVFSPTTHTYTQFYMHSYSIVMHATVSQFNVVLVVKQHKLP